MKSIKSTLRDPVITCLMVVMLSLSSFFLSSQAGEYWLSKQLLTTAASSYDGVGTVEKSTRPIDHDTRLPTYLRTDRRIEENGLGYHDGYCNILLKAFNIVCQLTKRQEWPKDCREGNSSDSPATYWQQIIGKPISDGEDR